MAVHKYVRFAAPYRSKTFNDKDALIVGSNGVLTGGEVTQSGSVVTIQPITIIRQGQIVDISVAISATAPLTLAPPYFVAIAVSSNIENVSEVITPIFVKRPQDINSQMVLVASYDGFEWISLPRVQLHEQAMSEESRAVATGVTGIAQGFDVHQTSTQIHVSPGTLVDVNGRVVNLTTEHIFTKTPSSIFSALTRIDNVVYRKPQDTDNRIGVTKYITGPTFYEGDGYGVQAEIRSSTFSLPREPKVIKSEVTGEVVSLFVDGTSLFMRSFTANFELIAELTLVSDAVDFDFCANPDGTYELVYTSSLNSALKHVKFNSGGTLLGVNTTLVSDAFIHQTPKVACVSSGGVYYIHIIFVKHLSSTESTIYYARLTSSGDIETPAVLLVSMNANLQHPSIEKDEDDYLLYLAFSNIGAGISYLHCYDLATVTGSAGPLLLSTPIELHDDVAMYDQNLTPASDTGAVQPTVLLTDTKDVFVMWKHFLYSSGSDNVYGLAIYHKDFKKTYGKKALILSGNEFQDYSVSVDQLNNLYLATQLTSGISPGPIKIWCVGLDQLEIHNTFDFQGSISDILGLPSVLFCPHGELLLEVTKTTGSTTYRVSYALPACVEKTQREVSGSSSDTNIANLSRPDDTLAVSGFITEESLAVRRIYEFMSMCVATGSISWQKTGSNILTIMSQSAIRFINRDGAITLATQDITLPTNHAVLINIPDEDVDVVATPEIVSFGEGILDRYGRNKMVIFWNVGGVLYTRFAPFRLTADGETVILGDSLSQEMLNWLGASDSTPNASNHNYSSITYIVQSDSHNTAIGKLDQALTDYSNAGFANVVPLSSGSTSVSVVFPATRATASYRLGLALENLVDSYPMMVPYIVTAKSTTGFTVTWTDPLDTANYALNFVLRNTV